MTIIFLPNQIMSLKMVIWSMVLMGFDDLSGGEYKDIIYVDYVDDGAQDTVSGGDG